MAASVCKASTWYTGWVSLQGQFGESVCRVSRQRQIAGPVLVNRQNFTDIGCSPMKYLPVFELETPNFHQTCILAHIERLWGQFFKFSPLKVLFGERSFQLEKPLSKFE